MKKLLVMTLVLTLVCTMFAASFTSYASGNVTFVGNNVEVEAGKQAVITVSVVNGADNYLAGAFVSIEYNSTYFTIPRRGGFTDHMIFGSAGTPSPVTANPFNYLAGEGIAIAADGDMFSINFDVAADTPAGVYPIKVSYTHGKNTIDDYLQPLDCETVDGSITVKSSKPTAESIGLTTDKTQVAKVLENVDVKNINGEEYKINSAIAFVSAINAAADVVEYGTKIYCEGYDGEVLTIKANNPYDVTADIKGFVAAVSSIREANYGKTFTAKAYAKLADGTTVEVEEGATGSYKPAAN